MGDLFSKSACLAQDMSVPVPRLHYKCRYDEDNPLVKSQAYTRTTDVLRGIVPKNMVKWPVDYEDYSPTEFTSAKILTKDGLTYKDPHITDPEYHDIKFNSMDQRFKCDRKSHHGRYQFIEYSDDKKILVPCNPVGRTGIYGRGHLGRWGPNHAADPIVTTWKRGENGKKVLHPKTNKPILLFVSIQRNDTKEWAIPGGMRDPGELIANTLVREFSEEALDQELSFDKFGKIANTFENKGLSSTLNNFFRDGTMIYKGYVDDPRNTDNAWMETIACNFHDEMGDKVGKFKLTAGDDAGHVRWAELTSDMKLFASHIDFLNEVALLHRAHW